MTKKKYLAVLAALLMATLAFEDTMASRKIPANGTKVNLYFGETQIPAVLNDSVTAHELLARLP